MKIPVVFTQAELDHMDNKPFDVYDKDIRKNMQEYKTQLDGIQSRLDAFNKSREKWTTK